MNALNFLQDKGLIKEGFSLFFIEGDFGRVELTDLLEEYKQKPFDINNHSFHLEKVKEIQNDTFKPVLPTDDLRQSPYSLKHAVVQRQLKSEENLIKQVVKQFTGKEVTLEDAPKIQRIFRSSDKTKYTLAFEGTPLGIVRYVNDSCVFSARFTSNESKS